MKKIICLVLSLVIILGTFSVAASAASVTVTLNGSAVSFGTVKPYMSGNTLMLPVTPLLEPLGCSVEKSGNTYIIEKGSKDVRVTPGTKKIIVCGNYVSVAVEPAVKSNVLCVPAAEFLTGLAFRFTLSGSDLKITAGTDEAYVAGLKNGATVGAAEMWKYYNAANDYRSNKQYSEAIKNYEKVIPNFVRDKDNMTLALIYGKLAPCYIGTKEYKKAAEAYRQSAAFWDVCDNGEQSARANRVKAARLDEEISLYLKTTDISLSHETTHNTAYETSNGIVLGFYNESGGTYLETSNKAPGMRLKYFHYGDDLSSPEFQYVLDWSHEYVIELGVQPMDGMSMVDDAITRDLANDIVESGGKFIVRFANEMNDPTSAWYTTPEEFKKQYIKFAKVFREVAPDVPLEWAPNFSPSDTAEDYYPGDAYVDYVGVSSYTTSQHFNAEQISYGYDLFGTGITTSRWSQQIDFLYNAFGYRKPIMIAEGAASYIDTKDKSDITEFAARSIKDFYTYLPMRYPNIKYTVYFDVYSTGKSTRYQLSQRPALAEAYNSATADDSYISSYEDTAGVTYVSFDTLGPTKVIPAASQELTSYIKTSDGSVPASVVYEINGVKLGTRTEAPYTIKCNFKGYAGKVVTIKVTSKDSSGKTMGTQTFQAKVAEVPGPGGFYDVKDSDYFADAVVWAVENGVTKGTDDTHFSPNAGCTRGQVVTFLYRAAGSPELTSGENPFTDVSENDYYYDAVLWAVSQGITKGMTETEFCPKSTCTRGQIVSFLHRAAQSPETEGDNPFSDVKSSAWYYGPVMWAVKNGITTGTGNTTFSPSATCTRAQVVTFMYRSVKSAEAQQDQ